MTFSQAIKFIEKKPELFKSNKDILFLYQLGDSDVCYSVFARKWIWKNTHFSIEEILQYHTNEELIELILFNLNDLIKL